MAGSALAEAGSFRDPAGVVFRRDGVLLRQVNTVYEPTYRRLMDSGLYGALVEDGRLVSHEEVDQLPLDPEIAARVLRPRLVPLVSYPYEWCFGQLRDAALLTLSAQRTAMDHGLSLKDASAYNVQWFGSRPVLIDTLSFEPLDAGRPWVAYRQFCQHFLAPLALMSRVDVRLGQLLRVHLDGVPLDLASRLLPMSTRMRPGLLIHLHAHATAQRSSARRQSASGTSAPAPAGRFSEAALRGLIDNLEGTVKSLRWEPGGTTWDGYYAHTNYSEAGFEDKRRIVTEWLETAKPATVWDLGANDGTFSRIAAGLEAYVASFDFDPSCVERNYREARSADSSNVLPLWLDLTNPSPALGWMHRERESWLGRGPADLVMALAVVHHLALGNNVPLPRLAEGLARCCGQWLIVEFVPKEDSQSARLLAAREDVFPDYDEASFLRAMSAHFEPVQAARPSGSLRTLHLLRRTAER